MKLPICIDDKCGYITVHDDGCWGQVDGRNLKAAVISNDTDNLYADLYILLFAPRDRPDDDKVTFYKYHLAQRIGKYSGIKVDAGDMRDLLHKFMADGYQTGMENLLASRTQKESLLTIDHWC